ncbi:MAG: glycosyltransferase family 4 protein, partial [Moorea sp. SIO2I5]|nr:glycosyltransferase family 4 protein [Moorena sp. SIO2I5]
YNAAEQMCVLVKSDSPMEMYLRKVGQGSYLKTIPGEKQKHFVKHALQWVVKQPRDWPLLLDNCVGRKQIPLIMLAAPALRLSARPVYHFFHDLALSYHPLGYLVRTLAFHLLSPVAICNSKFTAEHIHPLVGNVWGILYQPLDLERFNPCPSGSPPPELQAILRSGARLMLTPSRINKPEMINDKNLQALIPVLAHLKAIGHFYHSVVIGEDRSPGQINSHALLKSAEQAGVADRFTILPPTFVIEDYYKCADVVVTLAPREPFGRTVIEAIACAVPVVGSRTGGISEILQNFAPEWLVDPNNPVATAETIVRIATDPNTSTVLAKGQSWVKTQCSLVGYARRIMEITGLNPTEFKLTLSNNY